MTDLVIRNAEVAGVPGIDVVISGGRIRTVGPNLSARLGEAIDADGGALIPGLHDHHLHLHAMAADAASVRCGPPDVRDAATLADVLAHTPGDQNGWVRGVGYSETVAGDLDADGLDRLHSVRPVRIQHRSGAMWVLNSAAIAAAHLDGASHRGVERTPDGRPTGRVWRADTWLRDRLPRSQPPRLEAIGTALARFGITGVTDASPDLSPLSQAALIAAGASGEFPQRMHLLGTPLDGSISSVERISFGPYKIVLADSGLPDLENLTDRIRDVHSRGRAVAAHCVTREALLILLAALDEVGTLPGDRIEHGALIPRETIDDLRRRDLRVVTQPGFLADRGDDYLRRVDQRDQPDLYRCRSLLDGGVRVSLSSDAPYGPADPWSVITAAVVRRAPTNEIVGPTERITSTQALAGYLAAAEDPGGAPRRIRTGAIADVVLLRAPLADVLAAPSADAVRTTVIGGTVVHPATTCA
ncbi:amidohydrolase [Rhodococcus sp. SC4]|uniref:amidohydrolase family protein n=1 Tax=unclassified Rhodococcus (in: high G+C Gram-positive bacteria) TaxID=192944 RepID=UPI000769C65F|nr:MULTISPECIES: amidohydrolase family protein [unclassified Rhodococcus (in: high G+C Gram-positive bacteria)]KXF57142.1 amidohydrolase [Rhodococcus sp. SC4]KXX61866.1 amidohydrolase [Rhodococcus sp. LB1]PBC56436.1 amidohydrolase [Rhodococcus sp. ACPA1]